jgi:hypothetical protein
MMIFKEIVEVRALTSRSKGWALAWLALLIVKILVDDGVGPTCEPGDGGLTHFGLFVSPG